jgi:hypothetical protein
MKKLLLCLLMTIWAVDAFTQPVAIIPSPAPNFNGSGHGYVEYSQIAYNGATYFMHEDNAGRRSLAKYDGTNLTIIPHLNGMEYAGYPIVYGGYLYLKYESIPYFDSYLVRWDGSTLTFINNPPGFGNRGYRGYPIIYQGNLILGFDDNSSYTYLMKYNGSVFTSYALIGYEYDVRTAVVMGNTLYARYEQNGPNGIGGLVKFNGTALTLVPNPPNQTAMGCGLNPSPIFELGGAINMRYRDNSGLYMLGKYDGTTLTMVPSPVGDSYIDDFANTDDPYLFQNKAYLRFQNASGAYYLAEYNGSALTQVTSPVASQGNGIGYLGDPLGIDTVLYLRYSSTTTPYLSKYVSGVVSPVPSTGTSEYRGYPVNYAGKLAGGFYDPVNRYVLGICDGFSTTIIPPPAGFQAQWNSGYLGYPIVYTNYLYLQYEVNVGKNLARFDGQHTISIANPSGFEYYGYQGAPIILNNTLFLKFRDNGNNNDLAKLDSCGNSFASTVVSTCGSYTAPDGQLHNASGNYSAVVPNMYGCDSIISIQLTILQNSSATITPTACNTYTAPDGQVFTASGTYQATIANASGCDSIITVILDIDSSSASTISPIGCRQYIAPNGSIYTSSGTFTNTIPNAQGCDSVITVNLTIVNVNTNISQNGSSLFSLAGGGTYQWLDCSNGMAPIPGATGQTYTTAVSGSFAVAVTRLGCTDTSNCVNVTVVGLQDAGTSSVKIFPNPTNSAFFVEASEEMNYSLFAVDGRLLSTGKIVGTTRIDLDQWSSGMYLIRLRDAAGNVVTRRVVKSADQ